MTQQCLYLSSAELTTYLNAGYTIISGPHPTEAQCLANCNKPVKKWYCVILASSSSSSSSASSASSASSGAGSSSSGGEIGASVHITTSGFTDSPSCNECYFNGSFTLTQNAPNNWRYLDSTTGLQIYLVNNGDGTATLTFDNQSGCATIVYKGAWTSFGGVLYYNDSLSFNNCGSVPNSITIPS